MLSQLSGVPVFGQTRYNFRNLDLVAMNDLVLPMNFWLNCVYWYKLGGKVYYRMMDVPLVASQLRALNPNPTLSKRLLHISDKNTRIVESHYQTACAGFATMSMELLTTCFTNVVRERENSKAINMSDYSNGTTTHEQTQAQDTNEPHQSQELHE